MTVQQAIEMNTGKSTSFAPDHRRRARSQSVLEELFELLEEYAPAWYTEDLHDRAVAALLDRVS